MPALQLPHRRSLRLKSHDYAEVGAYFVTVVVERRSCLLADLKADDVRLTEIGQMVSEEWRSLEGRFPYVRLDTFVVMPNHLHGILWLQELDVGAALDNLPVGAPLVGALDDDPAHHRPPLVGALDDADRATTRVAPTAVGAAVGRPAQPQPICGILG